MVRRRQFVEGWRARRAFVFRFACLFSVSMSSVGANVAVGQDSDPLMRVSLDVTGADGDLDMMDGVPMVSIGDEFWLTASVQDLRAEPEGVFSNYVDVMYGPRGRVTVVESSLDYSDEFPHAPTSSDVAFSESGLMNELGSFGSVVDPTDPGADMLHFRVKLTAVEEGPAFFWLNPSDSFPAHEYLLRGLNERLSVEDIEFVPTNIVVVPEPSLIWTGIIGSILLAFRARNVAGRNRSTS